MSEDGDRGRESPQPVDVASKDEKRAAQETAPDEAAVKSTKEVSRSRSRSRRDRSRGKSRERSREKDRSRDRNRDKDKDRDRHRKHSRRDRDDREYRRRSRSRSRDRRRRYAMPCSTAESVVVMDTATTHNKCAAEASFCPVLVTRCAAHLQSNSHTINLSATPLRLTMQHTLLSFAACCKNSKKGTPSNLVIQQS